MNYEQLINSYLDNELDQTGEEALFNHLSTNHLLRQEFNRQLKLINMIQADMQNITVPLEYTQGVFDKLGFAPIGINPNANLAATAQNSNNKFSTKYLSLILLIFLMFTATASYYLLNENSNLKNKLAGIQKEKSKYPIMSSIELSKNNEKANVETSIIDDNNLKPISKNGLNQNNINNSNNNFANYNKNSNFYNNANTNRNSNINGNLDISYVKNNNINDNHLKQNFDYHLIHSFSQNSDFYSYDFDKNSIQKIGKNNSISTTFSSNNLTSIPYQYINILGIEQSKWSIQFRRLYSEKIYPPPTLEQESSVFADNAIGVWYHASPELSYGVEAGSEMFSQSFSNNKLNYTQSPIINWAGLAIRYNPNEWIIPYTLNPYFSQTLAYTSIGPLSKSQVGISYSPINMISLYFGAEYGILLYSPNARDIYNSSKFGFSGGVGINLK